MGRYKKYKNGTSTITLSIDADVLEATDRKANEMGIGRSEFISKILYHMAASEEAFCMMMVRKACQDMNYWTARKESMKIMEEVEK